MFSHYKHCGTESDDVTGSSAHTGHHFPWSVLDQSNCGRYTLACTVTDGVWSGILEGVYSSLIDSRTEWDDRESTAASLICLSSSVVLSPSLCFWQNFCFPPHPFLPYSVLSCLSLPSLSCHVSLFLTHLT